jgi:hypothetical protein
LLYNKEAMLGQWSLNCVCRIEHVNAAVRLKTLLWNLTLIYKTIDHMTEILLGKDVK